MGFKGGDPARIWILNTDKQLQRMEQLFKML